MIDRLSLHRRLLGVVAVRTPREYKTIGHPYLRYSIPHTRGWLSSHLEILAEIGQRGAVRYTCNNRKHDLSFQPVTLCRQRTAPKKNRFLRSQVFRKYLPGAEFTNTLPPFCEPEGPPVAESNLGAGPETTSSSSTREEEGVGGASDEESPRPSSDAGVVTREATACVEEVLAATSFYSPSSSEVLQ